MEYYKVIYLNCLSLVINYQICLLYIANKYGFICNKTKLYIHIYTSILSIYNNIYHI